MNHTKTIKPQASHISRRPKNFLRLWQWRAVQHHQKLPAVSGWSYKILGSNCQEMSKQSLLRGESSDGCSQGSTLVPKGSIAVYVGPELRRFVIPTSYLAIPEFRVLMDKAAEEFGFQQKGGLQIPCDEQDFEQILLRCGISQNI